MRRKSKWHTVRCVVTYRTEQDMNDADFARIVQDRLNAAASDYDESKMWAHAFQRVVSTMLKVRPRRLQTLAKMAGNLADKLRKL